MKSLISVIAVATALVACGHMESRYVKDEYVPDQDNSKDLEIRELNDDVRRDLNIPNAATVIVPRFGDKTVLFLDPRFDKETEFPVLTNEIIDVQGIVITKFSGSCCGDVITTTGYKRRICVSDAVAASMNLTCR